MKRLNKSILLIGIAGLFNLNLAYGQTQTENPCYFDEYTNNKSLLKAELMIQKRVEELELISTNKIIDSIRTIPVVVHVLHTGGSENISEAQIQSQIDILNEDYGKIPGSNGDGNGVDTEVRFCLAKIDPEGNCTNGIVRINTTLTNHQTYERALLKELSFWDNTKYLNIYLVKNIAGGILGYSSFPGGPPDEDGMVVRSNRFGNIGTASSSLGRTTSHEVGHWFGLYHTFNNGCGDDICLDGDYVCDTPPQASPSFNCSTLNTCDNDDPDENDQKENYMNYTPDACKNMFTNGQKMRMQATLDTIRTVIWSQENLVVTGCDSAYVAPEVCGVAANFVSLTPEICEGNPVHFMDISLNDATAWQWTFTGGTPETSTIPNPTITYGSLGSFSVKLVVSNDESTDSITIDDYILVSSPGIGSALPFNEDFESGVFPPQNIIINNPDGGVTWGLDSAASVSGIYSIKIDNYINTNYGSADEIILPFLDLSSDGPDIELNLTFHWAYAKSDPSFSDEMIVLLSEDCGSNFEQIFYRTGGALTTGPTQTTPFIPDSTQWKTANIPLSDYNTEQYIQIKIVNITDGGNNLYIDDIHLSELVTGIEEINADNLFKFYPNPAGDKIYIEFPDGAAKRTIKIYNTLGKLLITQPANFKNKLSLSTANLSNGTYLIQIDDNRTRAVKKLIISR